MSVDQIRAALHSSRPYYLYRVVNVQTSKPTVYIYDFKEASPRNKIQRHERLRIASETYETRTLGWSRTPGARTGSGLWRLRDLKLVACRSM